MFIHQGSFVCTTSKKYKWGLNYFHVTNLSRSKCKKKKIRAHFCNPRWITVGLVLSSEDAVGHLGVLVAWGGLSGSPEEVDEEDQHHSQVEAWEEGLSYLVAQDDLTETKRSYGHLLSPLLKLTVVTAFQFSVHQS